MCEFCENKNRENGSLITNLHKTDIPMGMLGKGILGLKIIINEFDSGMYAWFSGDREHKSVSVDISYCPFCGRKLNESRKDT